MQRRVPGVLHEVDQELLELIRIGADRDVRRVGDANGQARLDAGDALHEAEDVHRIEPRRGQLREPRVRGREAAERVGPGGDHREPAFHVVGPVVRHGVARQHRLEAPGNRLDWRERIVDLVADDAYQALPGLPLLVAQRTADVGEDQELVRPALLTERRPANFPAPRCAREGDVFDAW